MSRITIIGGGNIGSALAVRFSQQNDVCMYLNSKYEYNKNIEMINEDSQICTLAKIKLITNSLEEAINYGEWIFITLPCFLFKNFANKMISCINSPKHIVAVPGSGAFELYFKEALDKECTLTGLQRVHAVARIIDKGKVVKESGVRDHLKVASIPKSFNSIACSYISLFYDMPVVPLNNYLNITLINSNPILHTSRLYCLFKNYKELINEYDRIPLFYEEWDLESSCLLENLDNELFEIINKINKYGLDINQIVPILNHYDSETPEQMTKKINSINSLKGLPTPSIKLNNGKYIPDFSSRYFTSDFSEGLDILLSFAQIVGVTCENMEKVSSWYHKITNTKRYFDLSLFNIDCIQSLVEFYYK